MKRLFLLLIVTCIVGALAAPAWAAPSVAVTARLANDGRVRPGTWVTVTVDLSNQGGEMAGELVVESTGGPWEQRTQYVVPVTLPAGAKKRVPIEVPLNGMGELWVRLRSEGSVIWQESLAMAALPPDSLLIGVLSNDELGVPALAGLGQGGKGYTAQVVRLEAATFSSKAPLLETYDVIALSRFDSSTLTKEQLRALEAWVGQGGTLLLAGGPEWQRTLKPLPESLVPVALSDVKQVDPAPLATLGGKPINGQAHVSAGRLLRGQALASAGEVPLLATDRVGAGKVVYLALDPGLEPMVTWQGQTDLLERSLTLRPQFNKMEWGNGDHMMMSALQRIPNLGLPSVMVVGALLIGYLLLAGPLNYWILKRMDRRELTWVTVPLLSALFVGAVYGIGFSRRAAMISHLITVTELTPGLPVANSTAYLGLYAPSRTELELGLEHPGLVKPLGSYSGGPQGGDVTARVVAGEKTRVQLLGMNNYSMKGVAMTREIPVTGGLTLTDVKMDAEGVLTGRIQNNLDQPVNSLQVTVGTDTAQIGDLQPGVRSEEFRLRLSTTVTDPRMVDFIRHDWGPGRNMEAERRYNIMHAVFRSGPGALQPGTVTVFGWTPAPLSALNLPDLGALQQGANLVHAALPLPVDPDQGTLPPGVVIGTLSGGQNQGRTPNGHVLPEGSHTFVLNLPPLDPAKVAELKVHMQVFGGPGSWSLQAYNQRASDWVNLERFTVQPLQNWQEFVSKNGQLQLRVNVTNHLEMAAPTVSTRGVGQ